MAPLSRLVASSLLLLLTPVLGCTDDGGGEIAYHDLLEAQVDAACDYFVACGYATSRELCLDTWSRISGYPLDLDAAIANGTVEYDASAASACMDAIRGAPCDGFLSTPYEEGQPCARLFRGTLDDGSACFIDRQCTSGRCDVPDCTMTCCQGTCMARPSEAAIGEDCMASQDCVSGAYCDFSTGSCAAYGTEGEGCPNGFGCADGLTCASGVCRVPAGEGEDCSTLSCQSPLECDIDSMTCQRLRGEDEPCNAAASLCALGLVCDPGSSTCTRPGGVGSPCEPSFLGNFCSEGAYCDFETDRSTCQPLVADGGACGLDYECSSGYCGVGGTCEPEPVCVQ